MVWDFRDAERNNQTVDTIDSEKLYPNPQDSIEWSNDLLKSNNLFIHKFHKYTSL